jgi:hypothetical protein
MLISSKNIYNGYSLLVVLDKNEHIIYIKVRHMLNTKRIKWMYDHFGVGMAIRSAAYDLLAILAYICYCFTLPLQFFWMIWRGLK